MIFKVTTTSDYKKLGMPVLLKPRMWWLPQKDLSASKLGVLLARCFKYLFF